MFTALRSVENTAGEVNSTAKTLSLLTGMRHKQNNNSSFCVMAAPHEPKTGKKKTKNKWPGLHRPAFNPVSHPKRATGTLKFHKKDLKISTPT